jgi:hypothetical protein
MKRITISLITALVCLTGCQTKERATYPVSISGGYLFTYDDQIRDSAFQLAAIFRDSGYISVLHVDALENYADLLKKNEWEPDTVTTHFILCAYHIINHKPPNEISDLVEPDYIQNNMESIESMISQIDQILKERKG